AHLFSWVVPVPELEQEPGDGGRESRSDGSHGVRLLQCRAPHREVARLTCSAGLCQYQNLSRNPEMAEESRRGKGVMAYVCCSVWVLRERFPGSPVQLGCASTRT